MKYLISLAVFCLALIGCNGGGDEINYYTSEAQEMGSYQSLKNLPTCNSSSLGKLAYVKDSSAVFFCNDSSWVRVTKAAEKDTIVIMESETDSLVIRDSIYVDSISGCTFSKKDGLVAAICDEDTLWFEQTVAPAEKSSSSVTDGSEYDASANTLTDLRDGQVYKTTSIGTQVWMAENLNYANLQKTSLLDSSSFCYNNEPDSCAKYGRLYLWSAAMDSSAQFSTDGKGCGYNVNCKAKGTVRGVCPEGWHLPNDNEWSALFDTVGVTNFKDRMFVMLAGAYDDGFRDIGTIGVFWSSLEDSEEIAFYWSNDDVSPSGSAEKNYGFSVRCVMDSVDEVQVSSSSSLAQSLSSSSVNSACKYDASANTLTDLRDDQVYKTTTIGTQVWMAENLNYVKDSSWCYENYSSMCEKYGRLYNYDAAKTACPVGWHLPTELDWSTLVTTIVNENDLPNWAAAVPFVISNEGWTGVTATGNYGLNILPAGNKQYYNSSFYGKDEQTNFWCAEQNEVFMVKPESLIIEDHASTYGFSVRCIKD